MKSLTIGRVAQQAGVGVETERFSERQGLLEEPPRRQSGYREWRFLMNPTDILMDEHRVCRARSVAGPI
jgi:hypothetical protein